MFNNNYFWYNLGAWIIFSLMLYQLALPGAGLVALLLAVINFLLGIVILILGYKVKGLTLLLCAGILLLVGFSICSTATFM